MLLRDSVEKEFDHYRLIIPYKLLIRELHHQKPRLILHLVLLLDQLHEEVLLEFHIAPVVHKNLVRFIADVLQ